MVWPEPALVEGVVILPWGLLQFDFPAKYNSPPKVFANTSVPWLFKLAPGLAFATPSTLIPSTTPLAKDSPPEAISAGDNPVLEKIWAVAFDISFPADCDLDWYLP